MSADKYFTYETEKIHPYVQKAYLSCPEIVNNWHVIAGHGPKKCISRTVKDLKKCETLRFFVVTYREKFVGYFGLEFEGSYMPTLFIMPEFRKDKRKFWAELEKLALNEFMAGIYSKNLPCMKFYAKMGKETHRFMSPDGEATIFQFKRGKSSCR
ncbi:MAG: hypothetical protein NVS3B3_05910 [Aquirhabdus sp.]